MSVQSFLTRLRISLKELVVSLAVVLSAHPPVTGVGVFAFLTIAILSGAFSVPLLALLVVLLFSAAVGHLAYSLAKAAQQEPDGDHDMPESLADSQESSDSPPETKQEDEADNTD